jgi:four helix bundle protein
MFDFERLDVYQRIRLLNKEVLKIVFSGVIPNLFFKDQWKRSTMSISLNLSEGIGRFSKKEKMHFVTIARGSVNECVAIIDAIVDLGWISIEVHRKLYSEYETISKMLLGLYRTFNSSE